MQTNPPSVGSNVKLNPLTPAANSYPYNFGYINLKEVEPSLGIPTGTTFVQPNSVYYFTAFSTSTSYKESRRFTSNDNLVFVNRNLGFNILNPTYNVDINGNLRALSALILNLSAVNIVPVSSNNVLIFNYNGGVIFNTTLSANKNTLLNNVTANYLTVNNLTANRQIITDIYTIYQLTGAYVDHDVIVRGSLTSTNITASVSAYTPFLSSYNAYINNLTANNITVTDVLSANNIYANKIYGQIFLDPFSGLYYNDRGQLSISQNRNMILAVRPSDYYATDDPDMPRTLDGYWFSNDGLIKEDPNVLRPYFKTLGGVSNYLYRNGIAGNNLQIFVDEDIIEGEDRPGYFYPVDKSGTYSGCTITGNLSSRFYSTEWLGKNYPALTALGLKGGDFIWAYDKNYSLNGSFNYINFQELDFNNVNLTARYNLSAYYSPTANLPTFYNLRKFNEAPRKISFRTYVCADPSLSPGRFYSSTPSISAWTNVQTRGPVQGRQIYFNTNTNFSISNINFEFNTNATDSTGLVFYSGQYVLSNITVSLLNNGVYTYGALHLNSEDTKVLLCGSPMADPYLFTPATWDRYVIGVPGGPNYYNFGTPNYFPGYGLAIVGNTNSSNPTIVNYGIHTAYTGLINVNNGAFLDKNDYGAGGRSVGKFSNIQSCIILDGKFNAGAFYQLGDKSTIQGTEQLFVGNNFSLSSKNIEANNNPSYGTNTGLLTFYVDTYYPVNFKYINFNGSFSNFAITHQSYNTWTFLYSQNVISNQYNSFLNIDNKGVDPNYLFVTVKTPTLTSKYIDITGSLASIGKTNTVQQDQYLSQTQMQYVSTSNLINYADYYTLISPIDNYVTYSYTLNYYTSSIR